jgi:hypothetical protein
LSLAAFGRRRVMEDRRIDGISLRKRGRPVATAANDFESGNSSPLWIF